MTRLDARTLGTSDLAIPPIGMVAWAIGGSGWYGSMGPQHDNHSTPAIPAALDRGLNWIETAALYGLGHFGELLARAIQGRTPKPYVFTKCERVWDENGNIGACLKAESVRRGCKDSPHRWKLTRSISTKSTGRARRRHRRRLDRVSAPEGRRQGSVDRSV
jgi:aryl-alcohol dehydrogenase-like predicted oxidoreductase